jgi:hypothetical protein
MATGSAPRSGSDRGMTAVRSHHSPEVGDDPRVPAQCGMRSTGLIVVPFEEFCAARLISASG